MWWRALLLGLCCVLGAGRAHAAPPAASAEVPPEPPAQEAEPEPASPRASLQRFVTLCNAGRYGEAASFLDAGHAPQPQRAALARQLKAVLDRHAWLDLEKISDRNEGAAGDGLPPAYEQIALIPQPNGARDPVRLSRRPDRQAWMFSRSTVTKIPAWYSELPDRWLLEHLPAALLRPGPRNVLWWQWLGLFATALMSGLIAFAVRTALRALLRRAVAKTSSGWDDRILMRMRGPVALALALLLARGILPFLLLYKPAEDFTRQALRAVFFTTLLWVFWRAVDVAAQAAWDSSWSRAHPASRALIPLLRRVGKAAVGIVAVLLFIA